MFKPDKDKLKSIIFHLIKKPISDYTRFYGDFIWRLSDKEVVTLTTPLKDDLGSWKITLSTTASTYRVDLSEKEAMEIKWQLEDLFDTYAQNKLESVAEFALEEKGLQDDLLDN